MSLRKKEIRNTSWKISRRTSTLHNTSRYNKKLCNGTIDFSNLTEDDFCIEIDQKGVDMKIGLDIASISYKKQVEQIILISGDSDFVSAAKLARREGIDFILDPLGAPIKPDLFEHIDGLRTCDKSFTTSPSAQSTNPALKNNFNPNHN